MRGLLGQEQQVLRLVLRELAAVHGGKKLAIGHHGRNRLAELHEVGDARQIRVERQLHIVVLLINDPMLTRPTAGHILAAVVLAVVLAVADVGAEGLLEQRGQKVVTRPGDGHPEQEDIRGASLTHAWSRT